MHKSTEDSRIHVLFLLVSQSVGGAETHAISLANGLDQSQFRVSMVYLKDINDGSDLTSALRADITTFCGNVVKKLDFQAIRRLSDFVDREAVDLITCANPFPLLYASAIKLMCSRRLRITEILHSTEPFTHKTRVQMVAFRPLFWMSDLLVYVCNNQRDYWQKNLLWARASRVIHNGVDVSRFRNDFPPETIRDLRERYGFSDGDYIVGVCGYMRPEKGHCDLIQAIGMVRRKGVNVKCLLIGDGPTRNMVEALIAENDLTKHVAITGVIKDVRLAVASCDVIAIPSRNETFSIAALESMALHKPLIMSNVGGAAELVGHAVNGYLYPKGDIEALSERIMLLADRSRRETLGANAYHTVNKKFSSKIMIEEYAQAFADLVFKGKPTSDARS